MRSIKKDDRRLNRPRHYTMLARKEHDERPSLWALAKDVVDYAEDYDPYEFMDQAPTGMSRHEAMDYFCEEEYQLLQDRDHVKSMIKFIKQCVKDGYDNPKADGIIRRLEKLL